MFFSLVAKMSHREHYDEESEASRDSEEESNNSESDSDDEDKGFLDTEAIETNELSDAASEENESDDYDDGYGYGRSSRQFTLFGRLPLELRQVIWELFCPSLREQARVLDFTTCDALPPRTLYSPTSGQLWTLRDGLTLQSSTQAMRTVLAVHRESRAFALRVVPDALQIHAGSGDSLIRFNKEFDVILINGFRGVTPDDKYELPNLADRVQNIAIAEWEDSDLMDPVGLHNLVEQFVNLKGLFLCASSKKYTNLDATVFTTSLMHHHYIETFEIKPGLGEDLQFMYCWPDLRNNRGTLAKLTTLQEKTGLIPSKYEAHLEKWSDRTWAMVVFEFERGIRKFDDLSRSIGMTRDEDDSDESESDDDASGSDSGTDLDAYESEGIDDAEIVDTYSSSEEEDYTSRRRQRRGDGQSAEGSQAGFSSPEPSPEPEPIQRRKRKVVLESEDEDEDEDDQPTAKRVRRARALSSDSDRSVTLSNGQSKDAQPSFRSLAVLEYDDDGEEVKQTTRAQATDDSGSEDSDSSEEEEDSDDEPKPMTLAERLSRHRQNNPVSDDDLVEHDTDAEVSEEHSTDEDEESVGNPWIDDLAEEESDEGSEEDDDEDGY